MNQNNAVTKNTGKQRFETLQLRVSKYSRPADLLTPVGLYLKVRDRFSGSILLESADNQMGKNSRSFIAFDKIVNISADPSGVLVACGKEEELIAGADPLNLLDEFINSLGCEEKAALNLYGYIGYNAIRFIEPSAGIEAGELPYYSLALYRYVVEFDHLRSTLSVLQLTSENEEQKDLPADLFQTTTGALYPFTISGNETAFTSEEAFLKNVAEAKESCARGDVFQVVLARRFSQQFQGDDFNVYRALRMINPSPYLFYADFENFALTGSSPEAMLVSRNCIAEIHPIAGTYRKTGIEMVDRIAEEQLLADVKENAEHVMLVDLARNDLSRFCSDVAVDTYKEVQRYSHVIHLVSKVQGRTRTRFAVKQLRCALPAGTLSGAPKVRAMQIIDQSEKVPRDWYGGCIGTLSANGDVNMAILIRSFLRKDNTLTYQAGAGIVIDSQPENELQEINHKLGALRSAMKRAENI